MQVIKTEIVLWTAGFVLMTLLINVPLLPLLLRKTGLSAGRDQSLPFLLPWQCTARICFCLGGLQCTQYPVAFCKTVCVVMPMRFRRR